MFVVLSTILFLSLQQVGLLEVGRTAQGTVGEDAIDVHTAVLDGRENAGAVRSDSIPLQVEQAGTYALLMKSYDFNAYLVCVDETGVPIAEADGGWVAKHAMLNVTLEKGKKYQIWPCALRGGSGRYTLDLTVGPAPTLSDEERSKATEVDLLAEHAYTHENHGDDKRKLALIQWELTTFYYGVGSLDKAIDFGKVAVERYEAAFGESHRYTATIADSLGNFLMERGKFELALPYYKQAATIFSNQKNPDFLRVAISLNNAAGACFQLDDYQQAVPFLHLALEYREKELGSVHSDIAQSLNNLAVTYVQLGNFAEAEPLLTRAIAIHEEVDGPKHYSTALCLVNLANLIESRGDYLMALEVYERALGIWEETVGTDHQATAKCVNHIGVVLEAVGEYEKARQMFMRATQIFENLYGPWDYRTAECIENYGFVLRRQGKFEEALQAFLRSVEIEERVFGKDDPRTADGLRILGQAYFDLDQVDRALELCLRGLSLCEARFGPEHPRVGTALGRIAEIYQSSGDLAKTLELRRRALDIHTNFYGKGHPGRGLLMDNLAASLASHKKFKEAIALFAESQEIQESTLGAHHPFVVAALNSQARLWEIMGQIEEALPLRLDALGRALSHLDSQLPTMNEADRMRFLEVSCDPERCLEALSKMEVPSPRESYSLFRRWKGKATRLQKAGVQIRRLSGTGPVREKQGKIQATTKELSSLLLTPLALQEDGHADRINELRSQRLELEGELNRILASEIDLSDPPLEKVQAALPDSTVLVDFFVGERTAFAWVLGAVGDPQLINIGAVSQIREVQEAFLKATTVRGGRQLKASQKDPAAELFALLWAPLIEATSSASTIFISPDGFLSELPFETLLHPDGDLLVEKHRFVYEPTLGTRSAEAIIQADREGELIVVGGVNYFRRADAVTATTAGPSSRSRVGQSWSSLPATKAEMQTLRDLHQFVLEWEAKLTVVEGKDATEERIRAELPAKRYIHLATHGYFEPEHLPSLLLDAKEKGEQAQLDEQIRAVGLLPGLLSGLVFAGVNGDPDPSRDDGYLSAEEIQHLDLSACDLVVLSACETALGSARAGEGLMSLRRAFSVAGADAVISSLWKVDDEATAQLMKDFYANLWQKGMSRAEALHQAKLRMLRLNRIDNGGDAMASTWGAFVLSGQWN